MKRIFNKSYVALATIVILIIVNAVLCICLHRANYLSETKDNKIDELSRVNSYYSSSFKQALILDSDEGADNNIKLGVYLNLKSCDNCAIQTIKYVRSKFSPKSIRFYIDKDSANQTPHYDLTGVDVVFTSDDVFFKSRTPFFFVDIHNMRFLKFSHENEFSDITDEYIEMLQKYIPGIS